MFASRSSRFPRRSRGWWAAGGLKEQVARRCDGSAPVNVPGARVCSQAFARRMASGEPGAPVPQGAGHAHGLAGAPGSVRAVGSSLRVGSLTRSEVFGFTRVGPG